MSFSFKDMDVQTQELAAVGKATCLDFRINRPHAISIVANVALPILGAAGAIWATTTCTSLILPIFFAATSIIAIAYTTYRIYQWIQIPTEQQCKKWEMVFDSILEGQYQNAVKQLEAIANSHGPKDIKFCGIVGELSTLHVRLGYEDVPFQSFIVNSLACDTMSRFSELKESGIEENKSKISDWTASLRCGWEYEKGCIQKVDAVISQKENFQATPVQNYSPLLLSHVLRELSLINRKKMESANPKDWSSTIWNLTKTQIYLRTIAPLITSQSVGDTNFKIYQEMIHSHNLKEFYFAGTKLSMEDLTSRARDL